MTHAIFSSQSFNSSLSHADARLGITQNYTTIPRQNWGYWLLRMELRVYGATFLRPTEKSPLWHRWADELIFASRSQGSSLCSCNLYFVAVWLSGQPAWLWTVMSCMHILRNHYIDYFLMYLWKTKWVWMWNVGPKRRTGNKRVWMWNVERREGNEMILALRFLA